LHLNTSTPHSQVPGALRQKTLEGLDSDNRSAALQIDQTSIPQKRGKFPEFGRAYKARSSSGLKFLAAARPMKTRAIN